MHRRRTSYNSDADYGGAGGRPRRGLARLPGWALLLLFLAVSLAIIQFSWVLFAPWAVGWLPGPKLIGTYGGVLVAEQGARYPLLLELEPHVRARGGPGSPRASNLEGRAQLCTPPGQRFMYRISGYANPFGGELVLRLAYGDPKLSQLDLRLDGSWQGDRLELRPTRSNPFAPDGTFIPNRPLSSADPSDYFFPLEVRKDAVADLPGGCGTWSEPPV